MRPNVMAIFSVVTLAAAAALAIQQSPNFSSQTTGLYILTTDTPDYRYVVVPLPYREEQRTIRAPVPGDQIATAWVESPAGSAKPGSVAEPMPTPTSVTDPVKPSEVAGDPLAPSVPSDESVGPGRTAHTGTSAGHAPEGR